MAKPQNKSSAETRRSPRRIYKRPVGILCAGRYDVEQASQLSEGGLLFRSEKEFSVHDQVVASLILPSGGVVVARGEVIYEKPEPGSKRIKQYGVKFAALGLHLRRWIRNYVSAKTQAEAEAEADDHFDT